MLAIAVWQEKEAKGILTGNIKIKLFLLANNMIPYTEKSEDLSKKALLEFKQIRKFAGYEINRQNH